MRLSFWKAGSLLALLVSFSAAAQTVRIVVPFAAGGVQDIIARSISNEFGAKIGRTVIVENRTGAGGTIGNASVAKSAPDGTTLLLAAASHTITGHVYAKLPYHPLRDFTAVAHIGNVDYVLMINGELPVKTVSEFIAHVKASPGKFNFASAGTGSATHLSMAYFSNLAGVEMVHIPFKATNEAVQEVLVGRAHAVMASTIGALPFARDARVKMLGVSGAKRSRFAPELPTIAEAGLRGYEFDSWIGLLGPAGMPKATLEQMNGAIADLLKDPAILDRLAKQGVEPSALSPEAFTRLLESDFARMERVVKAAGARIE
ncbi:MAG TPA: tripartite tricarboxylate transporter substrate binding protein [Burkholderiales bacterium]|nr:tripartite tricarboxylate transporter substrate binding protein [Burkholderiales bacterium]